MYVLSYSVFFFKQKTAYEMRISDWSSDVCSSDLVELQLAAAQGQRDRAAFAAVDLVGLDTVEEGHGLVDAGENLRQRFLGVLELRCFGAGQTRCATLGAVGRDLHLATRSGRAHV